MHFCVSIFYFRVNYVVLNVFWILFSLYFKMDIHVKGNYNFIRIFILFKFKNHDNLDIYL